MAVHFIYRSAYETPLGRRIVHYPDKDLLSWFQRHWVSEDDFRGEARESSAWYVQLHELTDRVFQGRVYGFGHVWEAMLERGSPPTSGRALAAWLNENQEYPEGVLQAQAHALQANTDDDELDLALMMFDDEFAAGHPQRTAFLLHEEQSLPEDIEDDPGRFVWRGRVNDLKPARRGAGALYLIFIVIHDTGWLTDLYGAFRFRGLRLPDFVEFLQKSSPGLIDPADANRWMPKGNWPDELRLLRAAALRQKPGARLEDVLRDADGMHPHERVPHFFHVAENFKKYDRRTFLLGDAATCAEQMREVERRAAREGQRGNWIRTRLPSFIQTSPHVAQVGFTERADWESQPSWSHDTNTHWYFFDDLWAASHPDLARSLLAFAADDISLFTM